MLLTPNTLEFPNPIEHWPLAWHVIKTQHHDQGMVGKTGTVVSPSASSISRVSSNSK